MRPVNSRVWFYTHTYTRAKAGSEIILFGSSTVSAILATVKINPSYMKLVSF